MTEEIKVKARKKKKRRKKNYVLRFFIFILLIAGTIFAMNLEFFDVSEITVVNNHYYTAEQVIGKTDAKTGTNIFFEVKPRDLKEQLLQDAYIKDVDVSREFPSTIVINVTERKEAAAVQYGEAYIVIDENGLVLRTTDVEPKLPILIGLTLNEIETGKPLETEENYMLLDTLTLIEAMNQSDIYFKRIDLSGVMLKAYIYDKLVCSGTPEAILKNLRNGGLQKVLYELYNQGVERGTITVSSDGSCAFNAAIDQ